MRRKTIEQRLKNLRPGESFTENYKHNGCDAYIEYVKLSQEEVLTIDCYWTINSERSERTVRLQLPDGQSECLWESELYDFLSSHFPDIEGLGV